MLIANSIQTEDDEAAIKVVVEEDDSRIITMEVISTITIPINQISNLGLQTQILVLHAKFVTNLVTQQLITIKG
jgi:hypothetical protein